MSRHLINQSVTKEFVEEPGFIGSVKNIWLSRGLDGAGVYSEVPIHRSLGNSGS